MEYRELRLIKNKDGHGTINYKICLPTKWIKNLNLEKEEKVIVYTKNNSIIIKNKEEFKMRKFKIDKRIKKLEIELKGEVYGKLPFDNLEKYANVELKNLGNAYANEFDILERDNFNETVYEYNNELYIVDEIKHFNTELISATLLKIKEY